MVGYLYCHTIFILGSTEIRGGVREKKTLIVSCLECLTRLLLFTTVEFERLPYSPDLKMVLIFLLRKSSKRVQCSNEFMFNSHVAYMAGVRKRRGRELGLGLGLGLPHHCNELHLAKNGLRNIPLNDLMKLSDVHVTMF